MVQDGGMRKLVCSKRDSRVGFSAEGEKIVIMEMLDIDEDSKVLSWDRGWFSAWNLDCNSI